MTFNSFQYLIYFPILLLIYYSISQKFRVIFLLISSYYFYYCWKPEYVILLVIFTLSDYLLAIEIEKSDSAKKRRIILFISLFLNIGALFLFKYITFFSNSLKIFFSQLNIFINIPSIKLLAPVGISYFTFKKISYIIDVYRKTQKPENHFGKFALYVSFFPAIASGPIDRARKLIHQFNKNIIFNYDNVTNGLKLITWGLFKKVVIADRLAILVNQVFNNSNDYKGLPLIIAIYFYSFQIYLDFSGYIDIARGSAKMLGLNLIKNFDRPYFSHSIGEFWKRWHISLSTWLRDYLFLPISYYVMRKINVEKIMFIRIDSFAYSVGIIITWFLAGLWHGAGWTFIIWGLLHSTYLVFSHFTRKQRRKYRRKFQLQKKYPQLFKLFQICITFHLVSFAWIFFRANNLQDALYIIKNLFTNLCFQNYKLYNFSLSKFDFAISIMSIIFFIIIELFQGHKSIIRSLSQKPILFRWILYYLFVIFIILFGVYNTDAKFIYFQF